MDTFLSFFLLEGKERVPLSLLLNKIKMNRSDPQLSVSFDLLRKEIQDRGKMNKKREEVRSLIFR